MRIGPLLLPLLLLSAATGLRASERSDIDAFVTSTLRTFPEVPGISLAVVKDGRPLFAAGYGFADLAAKRPMTATTPVYIASATKSYTGLLCAMLAAEGKLDLDAPIVTYLPGLAEWPDGKRITTRMLLTHTAGIQNGPIGMRTAFTGEHTPQQLVELLKSSKSIGPQFRYSNLGYVVAGLIAESVTGRKWQDLVQERIFTPLRMTQTTAYVSRVHGLATPYSSAPGTVTIPNLKTDATMHPAGGIVTTAKDELRWLAANVAEPSVAYREAHKEQVVIADANWYRFRRYGYGFGWYWSEYDGRLLLHHMGEFAGWHAHVSYLPKERIGVAVVTNTSGLGSDVTDLVATYVYDRLIKGKQVEAEYATRTAELRRTTDERAKHLAAELDLRAKRPPSLTRAAEAYVGTYENASEGRLTIAQDGRSLRASIGPLSARLEPYTKPDTARIELIPGSGQILGFRFEENGAAATAIDWDGEVFQRTP